MNGKIQASHLARRAAVYLRQSTLKQVRENRESTDRQYALQQRAMDLGWTAECVDVLDEDLGKSGSTTEGRDGFRRLAEGIVQGTTGAILALEVSRLARSSVDWHRLIALCKIADVLIIDENAIYSPSDSNDRLLLGMKGTMSEVESDWIRFRLMGGRLNKVRRGEYRIAAPAGYVWDPASSRLRLDPDEQVQRSIALVFERFRNDGSGYAVSRYFAEHGLKLPAHDRFGVIQWTAPRPLKVLEILHNPIYAGAYVYGRREMKMRLVDAEPRRTVKQLPIEQWKTCKRDHHPAYIGWDDYMANRRRLDENRSRSTPVQRGAPREGSALLQGLAMCGRCGRRMAVHYRGRGIAQYRCLSGVERGEPKRSCWIVSGAVVDRAVEKLFLRAVQPDEVELGLAVVREVEKQAKQVDRQWELRLDRARYEAQLAERRYKAVDPDNRVVARTLEREWNDKLREIGEIESEHQEARRREKLELSDADRKRLIELSRDLEKVWRAKSTTDADRKNLLRMLIRDVSLKPIDLPEPGTKIEVLWQTGAVTEIVVDRPTMKTARRTPKSALAVIKELWKTLQDNEIAAELNRRSILTGARKPWTKTAVTRVRRVYGIGRRRAQRPGWRPRAEAPERRKDGLYSTRGVAKRLGVERQTVGYWSKHGLLKVKEGGGSGGRDAWFELNPETITELQKWLAKWRTPRRSLFSKPKEGHCA